MKLIDRIIYEIGWFAFFTLYFIAAGMIILPLIWALFLKPFYDFFIQFF